MRTGGPQEDLERQPLKGVRAQRPLANKHLKIKPLIQFQNSDSGC